MFKIFIEMFRIFILSLDHYTIIFNAYVTKKFAIKKYVKRLINKIFFFLQT